jgi:hypothetical protein
MPGGGSQPALNFGGATIGTIYNEATGGVVQIVDNNASKAKPKNDSKKKTPPPKGKQPPPPKGKQPAATSVDIIRDGNKVTIVGGNKKKP